MLLTRIHLKMSNITLTLRSIPGQPVLGLPLRLLQGPNSTMQSDHPADAKTIESVGCHLKDVTGAV